MNGLHILTLILGIAIGFFFGILGVHITYYSGWLNVIKDTDDGPYFYLELEKHPKEVMHKNYVFLKVKEQSRKNQSL